MMMSNLTREDDPEIESKKDGKTTSELVTLEESIKLNYYYKMAMFPTQALCFKYHDQRMQECKPKVNSFTGEDGCCKETSLLMSMEPRLFAIEHFREGKRRYISCHLGRFLKYYLEECNSSTRHAYELIRENTPCRLYLDLEFRRNANVEITSKKEEQLMRELIEELSIEFQNVYNIEMKSHHVIDLESSTDDKFSRHLIIHLPNGALFPDAISCGSFVKTFVGRLAEGAANGSLECDRPILAKHLFVFDKKIDVKEKDDYNDGRKKVCFVDLGVYTRNRIFRILGSSKYGKDPNKSVLRIARTNTYPIPKSLYNIDFSCIKNLKDLSEFLVDTFVVPIESQRDNVPLLSNARTTDDSVLNSKIRSRISKSGPNTKQFTVKLGPSPFFELDKFVSTHLATRYGLNGSIRSWSQEGEGSMNSIVTYQIKDNRWCENIQRPHKSNNVMWHVSISDMEYWQGCHDPECRNSSFRGKRSTLPENVQREIREFLLCREIESNDSFDQALLSLSLSPYNSTKREDDIAKHYNYAMDNDFVASLMNLSLSPKALARCSADSQAETSKDTPSDENTNPDTNKQESNA